MKRALIFLGMAVIWLALAGLMLAAVVVSALCGFAVFGVLVWLAGGVCAVLWVRSKYLAAKSGLGRWIASRLINRSRRTPYEHIPGYMERFWLFRIWREGGQYAKVCGRIHHIMRSDEDRHAHDHPWPYITIILRGGYVEEREYPGTFERRRHRVRRWHGPGSILFRRSTDRHRLILPESVKASGGCWTLFMTGPKRKSWFFYTEEGPIGWREYPAWRKAREAA
jgi:hypothetical protein